MSYSGTSNVCATCRYWLGRRKVDNAGQYFDPIDEMGKCCGPFGSFNPNESIYYGGCSKWESLLDINKYYGR